TQDGDWFSLLGFIPRAQFKHRTWPKAGTSSRNIMSAIPQQVLASQKASLDKLIAVQGTFFGGFEKLVDLNLKVLKATFDEVAQKSQEAIGVKDPQEALAFASGLTQPNAEKAVAYSKHVYDIV